MQILLYCHHDDWDVKKEYDVSLHIDGLEKGGYTARHLRIDDEHSNAYAEWLRQGMPNWPNEGQYAAIKARDGIEALCPPQMLEADKGGTNLSFSLPTHAVSLILIEKKQ